MESALPLPPQAASAAGKLNRPMRLNAARRVISLMGLLSANGVAR